MRVAVSYAAASGVPGWGIAEFMASTFANDEVRRFRLSDETGIGSGGHAQAIVGEADLIVLGPGCPVLGARRLRESGAYDWLRRARRRGASVLGISAGAIVLGEAWAEWPDLLQSDAPFDGGRLVRCGGLVPGIIDCHDEHDGWGELQFVAGLMRATRAEPVRVLGIPTGSGVVVSPEGSVSALGPIFDANVATRAVA